MCVCVCVCVFVRNVGLNISNNKRAETFLISWDCTLNYVTIGSFHILAHL